MNDTTREMVWERDKGICQKCWKKLSKIEDSYDEILQDLSNLKEIEIYKWSRPCWKCGSNTPIILYNFAVGYNYSIGDLNKIDLILMKKYSFVKKVFSRMAEKEVIGNICVNCGILQGNFFLKMELRDMKVDEEDMEKMIDTTIPNTLTFNDLPLRREELIDELRLKIANVHHKDKNRKNNELDNLILLCRDCHVKVHVKMRKNHPKVRSKAQRKRKKSKKLKL